MREWSQRERYGLFCFFVDHHISRNSVLYTPTGYRFAVIEAVYGWPEAETCCGRGEFRFFLLNQGLQLDICNKESVFFSCTSGIPSSWKIFYIWSSSLGQLIVNGLNNWSNWSCHKSRISAGTAWFWTSNWKTWWMDIKMGECWATTIACDFLLCKLKDRCKRMFARVVEQDPTFVVSIKETSPMIARGFSFNYLASMRLKPHVVFNWLNPYKNI